jgi:CRP-like cAMP-binding protein
MPRAALRALLVAHPPLLLEFLRRLSGQISFLYQDLVDVSIADTRRRVVSTLLTLGERYGDVDEGGHCHLRLPMTQQELTCLVGAARETVSRICTGLANVRMEQRTLTISNWDEFKAMHG